MCAQGHEEEAQVSLVAPEDVGPAEAEAVILPRTPDEPFVVDVARGLDGGGMIEQALDPYDLLHYKDTTAVWRDQYDEEFVFPTLSSEEIVPNDSDKDFMYPPVPPPKVGRPKKGGRIKGSKEKALKRKHSLPICSKCGNAGHISSNKQCPERTGKRKR